MFFIGLSVSSLLPLRAAESGIFRLLDWVAPYHAFLAEAADFADAGRGVMPYIGAVIFAVCEKARVAVEAARRVPASVAGARAHFT